MHGEFNGFVIIKQIEKPWLYLVMFKAIRKRQEHSRSREKHFFLALAASCVVNNGTEHSQGFSICLLKSPKQCLDKRWKPSSRTNVCFLGGFLSQNADVNKSHVTYLQSKCCFGKIGPSTLVRPRNSANHKGRYLQNSSSDNIAVYVWGLDMISLTPQTPWSVSSQILLQDLWHVLEGHGTQHHRNPFGRTPL